MALAPKRQLQRRLPTNYQLLRKLASFAEFAIQKPEKGFYAAEQTAKLAQHLTSVPWTAAQLADSPHA
jgi:hypothetical protein